MNNRKTVILEDVLEGYAVETPTGNDREVLKRWMKEYPQFAEDLLDFAATRAAMKYSPEPEIPAEKAAHYRELGLNNLRNFLETTGKKSESLSSLTDLAKERGLNKRKLATALGLSISLLMYLEKRRLQFATIPRKVIKRTAEVLKTTEQAVADYLRQDQDLATNISFKSRTRPELPGESFELAKISEKSSGEFDEASRASMERAMSKTETDDRKDFAEAVREDQTLSPKEKEELLK